MLLLLLAIIFVAILHTVSTILVLVILGIFVVIINHISSIPTMCIAAIATTITTNHCHQCHAALPLSLPLFLCRRWTTQWFCWMRSTNSHAMRCLTPLAPCYWATSGWLGGWYATARYVEAFGFPISEVVWHGTQPQRQTVTAKLCGYYAAIMSTQSH